MVDEFVGEDLECLGDESISQKVVENSAKYCYVMLTPESEKPMSLPDFYEQMEALLKRFNLKFNYKGSGISRHLESAAAADVNPYENNTFNEYYIKFDSSWAAQRFVMGINNLSVPYAAEVSDTARGLGRLALDKQISRKDLEDI